jgi:diacylglycerol kinase (ATP)
MRAAAILGLGCSPKNLKPFQADRAIEWRMGVPATASEADVILLFGGDGTIHRHLGHLVRLRLPVLIVPSGSGNDFARALGLRRVRDSLAAWTKFCAGRANVRTIDLGMIISGVISSDFVSSEHDAGEAPAPHNSRYFCCVANVGLDSEVARRANLLPRWLRSRGGYVMTLLPTIFRFNAVKTKIFASSQTVLAETSGEPSTRPSESWVLRSDKPTILAAFANTPSYGGGMMIAPQAKIADGLLDVCVVADLNPFRLFCMFPTVYGGRHIKLPEVSYSQETRVRIETERPFDVYADGEYVSRTPVEIAIQRAALKVVAA